MSDAYVMSDKTSGVNSEPDKISVLILAVRVQGCASVRCCSLVFVILFMFGEIAELQCVQLLCDLLGPATVHQLTQL